MFHGGVGGLRAAGVEIFMDDFAQEALVRLSRGLGSRPPLPEVFGFASVMVNVYGRVTS